jgi:flavin-dependent dehydrogenase
MKNVKRILVVGGGTAGLISALILKRKLNIKIDLVYSKNVGIVGVGEGSTEHWREFMQFIGIDPYTLIKECDATYKSGIMFKNWGQRDYLHSVVSPFDSKISQYPYIYAKQIAENSTYINPKSNWDSKINSWHISRPETPPVNQYHFNTHKLNEFLTKIAKSMGIGIIEDDINDVILDEEGYIKTLTGSNKTYDYDFYIDSTGFKRILMNKLGAKWQSYSKYLKMKSAITFQTPEEENFNYWTLAQAMDYGWMFKIPVWGRNGNGYIFDSDYINADQAKLEVEKLLGHPIEVGKQFNFDPGALETPWIKNCCAIGLSASFVEPLEASSIGTSIQQSFLLMHKLTSYNDYSIEDYNKSVNDIMENIRDFIILHYLTNKTNTEFWKTVRELELPDSLKSKLARWKDRLPIAEDFNNMSDYILFTPSNFIVVMEGLELFDRNSIRAEYNSLYSEIRENANSIINQQINFEKNIKFITHKEMITTIRNYL